MTYYVFREDIEVAGVTEVAYIVTEEPMQGDVALSKWRTEAEAEAEAKRLAEAAAKEGNKGYRWADLVDGFGAHLSELRRYWGCDAELYLSGAGQTVPDHEVADVLGSDARDLMEGLEAAAVAVAEVLSNTGRWVTEWQYLLRLRNLHATHGGEEGLADWARRHGAGEGLVAELVSSAK